MKDTLATENLIEEAKSPSDGATVMRVTTRSPKIKPEGNFRFQRLDNDMFPACGKLKSSHPETGCPLRNINCNLCGK
jgi:hypothetical protein